MGIPAELVIFDCDGVLVDSERISVRLVAEMMHAEGWNVSEEEITERYVGRSTASMVADIPTHLGRPLGFDWSARYDPISREAVLAELRPVPGIVEALDRIAVPSCVASSGSHEKMRLTLGATGLLERFEGRIFSRDEVENGKPAPDLFVHAALAMGADASRCIVVEDSAPGVEAARAAGMRSLGYVGGLARCEWLEGPGTKVFGDMADLPALIAEGVSRYS